MENKKLTTSLVASFLLATNLYSNDTNQISSVTISSSLIETNEKDATYTTEIYTKEDIESSKSKDIYEFLNSQTSLVIAPNGGNTFTQKIDLRGYGITDGYQNLVVTVNGRRLNNIDMTSQLLSSIPLESVEKIEIIKGSGSVQYGDGANSGAINIITNGKNENYIKTYFGNNGTKNSALSLGFNNDNIILNTYMDYTTTDGSRNLQSGTKDDNYSRNRNINLIYFPTDNLEVKIGRNFSDMNIKYAGALTLNQYKSNPYQFTTIGWDTEQYFSSYVTDIGLKYDFLRDYSFETNFSNEDKKSMYSSGWTSNYDYKTLNSKLNINKNIYSLSMGIDVFEGDRITSSNTVTKENKALFITGNYFVSKQFSISSGLRNEEVKFDLLDAGGVNKDISLNALDLGFNYKLDENNSFFANFNKSYQTPDLDRLFWWGSFNGYIEPAKVKNFNFGYTGIQDNNKLKISLFYSKLKNEIYFYSVGATQKNTNIDKSHKYGIEIFDKYLINKNLYTSLNYSYIIAKIDEETESGTVYDGKDLPGVSNHNLTVNIGYEINKFSGVLSHTYRSEAYGAEDFGNSFSQKQEAYNSTDLSVSYKYKNLEVFGKIQNLFDEDNGLWINDDQIYPVNFERTYYAGIKYRF
ncbi:TonB-dependent receptor plug domain-containing protein [Arcobacter arenosus]|uniref:TonB-dependent receptor n=1 Tax=Arcobacter arenosus TaxID=2576037 RepID=A0A5R8XZ47_9BACT|nr:TonB-dependent receptor [Arcobacter arenosus]TLP36287.1 TonB-dependent receptor [Arcobacter arenosus]